METGTTVAAAAADVEKELLALPAALALLTALLPPGRR